MTARTPSACATATDSEFSQELTVPLEDLSAALARLRADEAISLPVLSAAGRQRLLAAARRLPYRDGTSVIGEGERRVYQDFQLTVAFEADDLFHRFAAAFGALVRRAADRLRPAPLSPGFRFNDLILQRYPPGAGGITAHRDHITYRELVALINLSGDGRFTLSADRSGTAPRELPLIPGDALLMVAPGFADGKRRPFHALTDFTRERYSLGLRYLAST